MITRYTLPGEAVFPEGITEGPDRTFYVSGSADGTVFRGSLDTAELEVWQPAGADGRDQGLGMIADGFGRLLVCGGEGGVLYAYDISSGALVARHAVPGTPSLLNDVCVLDGYAYVTDSLRPVVWRLALTAGGVGAPEEWLDVTGFGGKGDEYLNGIVAARTPGVLIAAEQRYGALWRVDAATGDAALIDLGGVEINGDGMVWVDDVLYVCGNTDEPDGSYLICLVALAVDADSRSVRELGRWLFPPEECPTTCAYLDGTLLLVNSQFAARSNGNAKPPFTVTAMEPPVRG